MALRRGECGLVSRALTTLVAPLIVIGFLSDRVYVQAAGQSAASVVTTISDLICDAFALPLALVS